MKFSEEVLREFKLAPQEEREPVNVMKVSEMLDFMEMCATRISGKSLLYASCTDADVQLDCIDIVTAKLNDFVQVFKDLIIFLRKEEGTHKDVSSLRYCVMSYDTFGFEETESERSFLKEMLLRNEITHDYFNREIHLQKLIWIMENCGDGAIDVYENLKKYCTERGLMDRYADNGSHR